MRLRDREEFEKEAKIRMSFFRIKQLLDLPSSSENTLTELVASARGAGAEFCFHLNPINPFPDFLPDHQYEISNEGKIANGGFFLKASFHYWLRPNKAVIWYRNGKITGLQDENKSGR